MMGKRLDIEQVLRGIQQERGSRRHFIQPLSVALVFVIFALLFFGMAMMDLGRLESLLVEELRNKALYVVEAIEKASQEKYSRLMRDGEGYGNLSTGTLLDDQSFSLQESLVRALIDVARHVDLDEEHAEASASRVQALASSGHFRAIGVFDDQGGLEFQSAPLPANIMTQAKTMVKSGEEITIHLFHRVKALDSPGFVAIRKRSEKGAVVLVLGRRDMEYWGCRIATQAAMEDLQWGAGVAYMSVEDKAGQTLARFGEIPKGKIEDCLLVAGAAKGSTDARCVKVGDTRFLDLSFPFAWEGKRIGVAHVGLEANQTNQLLISNRKRIFLWTGLMVLIGLFAMGTLYRSQNRHVARIQAMRERLSQAERLSSLGKLGAGVAHEIRNPLNAINMAAQRLGAGGTKEKLERISYIIQDETKRLNKIVEDFLSLSRSNRMEFKTHSITRLLDRIFFLLQEEAGPRGIHLEKQWTDQSLWVLMDAGKMEQALLNIIRNAMESISGEGCITICCDVQGKDRASVRIKDTGSGIPAGEEKRVFDPFYTSKENGVGLGLAIAHEIVLAHGGEIRVESEVGKGSTLEILLPIQL